MTAKELFGVGIRLLGVWLFLEALLSTSQSISYFVATIEIDKESLILLKYFALGKTFVFYALSFVFVKMPYAVSSLLIPKTYLDNTQINWEEKLVERIGFVLMGMYILSWAIPDIVDNIGYYFYYREFGIYSENSQLMETKIGFLVTLIEFGIGLLLTFGARGVVNIIHKVRNYQ